MSAREASAEMGVGSVYRARIGGLKCRVCSGDGAGSAGPAARPCASRTRKLTFTHTDPPRISMWLQEVGHHAGVPRRGLPPPSALLGARIRRAQTACIVALGASSVLVRPTEAGTSRTQRGVEDHSSPPGKPRQVWFPGLISSSRIASRAHKEEEMLRLGRTGHAHIIRGPFPWFFGL